MLTSEEAAARLGVKRETLYAYVSRGLLRREMALDGRSSLFDPEEISSFRSRRRRAGEGELGTVLSSAVTSVNDQALLFRGRDVAGLIATNETFEEVVNWLWQSDEPWPAGDSAEHRAVVRIATRMQKALPERTSMMDRLRVSVAAASAADPLRHDLSEPAICSAGRRLLKVMVDSLPLVASDGEAE